MIEISVFVIVSILMKYYISFARKRGIGQLIKKEGPDLHGYKEGTPTMGGVVFIPVALLFMVLIGESLFVVLSTLSFFVLGMADDLIGILRRDAYSMRARTKFTLQVLISTALVISLGNTSGEMIMPFHLPNMNIGFFRILLAIFLLTGVPNAVNLTDGLDGLAGWVFLSGVVPMYTLARNMDGGKSLLIISSAILAFLLYNSKPASVFMGDAGSMAMGAYLASYALKNSIEIFLVFFGFIFVVETISVIIQVVSYKTRRKRIFLMSPIHHHFELLGWDEGKIVFVFTALNLMASLLVLGGSV